jgi:hypothetical protein
MLDGNLIESLVERFGNGFQIKLVSDELIKGNEPTVELCPFCGEPVGECRMIAEEMMQELTNSNVVN